MRMSRLAAMTALATVLALPAMAAYDSSVGGSSAYDQGSVRNTSVQTTETVTRSSSQSQQIGGGSSAAVNSNAAMQQPVLQQGTMPMNSTAGRTEYYVTGGYPQARVGAGGRETISYPTNADPSSMSNDTQARAFDIGRLDASQNKNDRKAYGAGAPDTPPQAFRWMFW